MKLKKPEKLILTKATVPELSKCHQGRGIAIKTKRGQEVIIVTKDDDDLLSVVNDLCGHHFKVDIDGVKNVTVFGTKDTVEVENTNSKKEGRSTIYRSQ